MVVNQLYLKELGASRFLISLNSSLMWVAVMFFSRFWGSLSDIFHKRKLFLLLAGVFSTLTILILAMSSSIAGVLTGRFFTEVFGAALPPAALAFLSERGSSRHRGKRISIFTTSKSIGMLGGTALGGFLVANLGYANSYYVIMGISSLIVFSALFAPETDGNRPPLIKGLKMVKDRMFPSIMSVKRDSKLSQFGLFYLYVGVMIRKAGIIGMISLIMVYFQESYGFAPYVSSTLVAINPASQAMFMYLAGKYSDVYGRKSVFMVGYFITIFLPIMLLLFESVWLLGLTFFLLGLSFATFISGVIAYIGDIAPQEKQGELLGLLKMSQGIGGIIGPIMAGILSSPSVLGYQGMYIVLSALLLVGSVVMWKGTKNSNQMLRAND